MFDSLLISPINLMVEYPVSNKKYGDKDIIQSDLHMGFAEISTVDLLTTN